MDECEVPMIDLSPSVLRRALAWADEAPSTRAHPAPERHARELHMASAGPREQEIDPCPSSRPTALEAMGVGWLDVATIEADSDVDGALREVRRER